MKWGSRGLNWWAGKGEGRGNPLESLFGGDREAKAGAGASYTCNVTLNPPLTVKLKSLKQSSNFIFRFWDVLVCVNCLPDVHTGHGPQKGAD